MNATAHDTALAHPEAVAPVRDLQRTPRHAEPLLRHETARLGMWVFLAGELLFFGVVLLVYGIARLHEGAGFAAASAKTDLLAGTLNTALLLTGSAAMAAGAEASECNRPREAARWLWIAAALGLAFLAVKGMEYRHEWTEGLFPGPGFAIDGRRDRGAELFFAWYFVATALHALHLAAAVALVAGFALVLGSRRRRHAGAPRVHALALYWHFVDVVWIALYPLIYLVAPRG
jgi:cytochrome c oxidase subunit 3